MEFINIKKTTYLSVEQMNAIYNNFQYLKEKLESNGLTIGNLKDNSVADSILPKEILNQFNNVEFNIQELHKTLSRLLCSNEKHFKNFTWSPITTDRKNEVWRWIDWLYNVNNILIRPEVLTDINNETITDINNEEIIVLAVKEK